jgi:hypothetical protein
LFESRRTETKSPMIRLDMCGSSLMKRLWRKRT